MLSRTSSVVIVGGGQAGGWAAKTLRAEGFDGRIVLIGDERHPPHERPPLSKKVLAGEAAPEATHLFKPDALDALGIEWRLGERVAGIDRPARQVVLGRGERIGYDKLILCTGGRARTLPLPGSDLPGVFTLRTIDDSLAIGRALQPGKRVAVVGGGWIGLEVAATARGRGAEVTVIEALPRLCERTVPSEVSRHLLELHRKHGVEVLFGASVTSFSRRPDGAMALTVAGGRELVADVTVIGVGLVANDELAREAGLACENGVLVDTQCRTSDPDVLAAGDVAVAPNARLGRPVRLESWQNAQDQAIAAAKTALGQDVRYDPLPWFWSDQYDMNLQIYGFPLASHQAVIRGEIAGGSFVVFYLDAGRVQAAVGVNSARDLRFARRLIDSRKPVRAEELADEGVALAKL
jgi:3-phenylpropionate/trans-cinnamate dioxygenase ferredoxin reductase component